MCNLVCEHCHVDAGPDRKEIMTRQTMQHCLDALDRSDINTVDLTGGAPEMNPDFKWFVQEISRRGKQVIVRSNLTILVANESYRTYPEFFARNRVTVIASLPCYTSDRTDVQRGDGVFRRSIEALQMLNDLGYGQEGTGLNLHLVYNPVGPHLAPDQAGLKQDYKKHLKQNFGVDFNELYAISNMPVGRYLDKLLLDGSYEKYMDKLVDAFNPSAAAMVMCRDTISVGWDGGLYDCDFNQMLDLRMEESIPTHIRDFDKDLLEDREIVLNQHCYGCTAGAGSSCQGAIT
jgi:radical SAM/Cys-rich protein